MAPNLMQCGRRFSRVAVFAAVVLAALASHAATFSLDSNQNLVGTTEAYVTRQGDTLLDIARTYDLGYSQLIAANPGIDPWLPGANKRIAVSSLYLLPDGPRIGIIVSLSEQRLYYFPPGGQLVETFPIGIAVEANLTPIGSTRVLAKDVRPSWYPPRSIRMERPDLPEVVPPGSDNPLGEYALRLGWPSYLIHGTNKPYGVGRHVSHGCIRLYPEDIARLFQEVKVGTQVRVIEEEVRLAWINNELYLAVFPSRRQVDDIGVNRPTTTELPYHLVDQVVAAAGAAAIDRVDWHGVGQAGAKRNGIPVRITRSALF